MNGLNSLPEESAFLPSSPLAKGARSSPFSFTSNINADQSSVKYKDIDPDLSATRKQGFLPRPVLPRWVHAASMSNQHVAHTPAPNQKNRARSHPATYVTCICRRHQDKTWAATSKEKYPLRSGLTGVSNSAGVKLKHTTSWAATDLLSVVCYPAHVLRLRVLAA